MLWFFIINSADYWGLIIGIDSNAKFKEAILLGAQRITISLENTRKTFSGKKERIIDCDPISVFIKSGGVTIDIDWG